MRIREMMQLGHAVGASDVSRIETLCARALHRDPRDYMALMVLADTYWREERNAEALAYALQVLELDPATFDALRIIADVYAKCGEHDQAYPYVKRFITAEPPIQPPAALVARLLRPLSWVSKLRHIGSNIASEDTSYSDWMAWATAYVAWYESQAASTL